MDATENDVPSVYEVQGFPTIYFAPKNSKDSPRKYEVSSSLEASVRTTDASFQGGREVDDFIKFLAKEATDALDGYDRNGSKKKGKKTTDDEL